MDPVPPDRSPQNAPQPPDVVDEAAPQQAPEQAVPGFIETLEAGLRGLFMPVRVFSMYSQLPCPDLTEMILTLTFWTGAGMLLAFILTFMRFPADIGIVPLALSFCIVLVLAIPMSFGAAGVLHALAMLSGGRGGFGRSYQALTFLAAMAPVCALLLYAQVPFLWLLPTVYLTYLAVCSVEQLHQAPGAQALIVLGAFGAVLVAAQFIFHRNLSAFQRKIGHLASIYTAHPDGTQRSSPDMQDQVRDMSRDAEPDAYGDRPAADYGSPRIYGSQSPQQSGLDMLRRPQQQAGTGSTMPYGRKDGGGLSMGDIPTKQDIQRMNEMSVNLIQKVNQEITNNPEQLNKMTPEQRRMFDTVLKITDEFAAESERTKERPGMSPEQKRLLEQVLRMVSTMRRENPNGYRDGKPHVPQQQQQPRRQSRKRRSAPPQPQPESLDDGD